MIKKTDSPLPWFRQTLGWYSTQERVDTYSRAVDHMILHPMAAGHRLRRFYLYEEDESWFAPIFEDVEQSDLWRSIDKGQIPSFGTLPVFGNFIYENTHLTEHFCRRDIPWGDFGIKRVDDGWRDHLIYRPESMDSWVRGVLKKQRGKDYISHIYGTKSKEVVYRAITGTEISEMAHSLLPEHLEGWNSSAVEKAGLLKEVTSSAKVRGKFPLLDLSADMLRYVTLLELEYYLAAHLIPASLIGDAFAIIGEYNNEVVSFISGTITPLPESHRVAMESDGFTPGHNPMTASIELVMTSNATSLYPLSLVPVGFIRFVEHAFFNLSGGDDPSRVRNVVAVNMAANYDERIDAYKRTFLDRTVKIPGLRWL